MFHNVIKTITVIQFDYQKDIKNFLLFALSMCGAYQTHIRSKIIVLLKAFKPHYARIA